MDILLLDFNGITIKHFDLRIEDRFNAMILHKGEYMDVNYVYLDDWKQCHGIQSMSYYNSVIDYVIDEKLRVIHLENYVFGTTKYSIYKRTNGISITMRKDNLTDNYHGIIELIKTPSLIDLGNIQRSACDYVNFLISRNREEQIDLLI